MPNSSPRRLTSAPPAAPGLLVMAVEHVDRTVIGRFVDAAAGIEPGLGGHDAVLHAVRLVAGRHAEQIAEGPDSRAHVAAGGVRQIEMVEALGLDLQDGDFQPRIGPDQLGFELAAVGQHDGDVVGVEHVAPGGQDVPFGRNQKAALIGFQPLEAAGAVELDHLGLGARRCRPQTASPAAAAAGGRGTAQRRRRRSPAASSRQAAPAESSRTEPTAARHRADCGHRRSPASEIRRSATARAPGRVRTGTVCR